MVLPLACVVAKDNSMNGCLELEEEASLRVPSAITVPPLMRISLSASIPPSGLRSLAIVTIVPPLIVK
ncbi:hypothetical protein D3C80_1510720 [compost metagenome]